MPASLSQIAQQNPNIESQIQEWQSQRTSQGQNPTDWEAFRQHLMMLGAADPGPEAPPEFQRSAVGGAASAIAGQVTGQQPRQQEGQQQQRQQQGQRGQQEQKEQGGEGGGGLLGKLFDR
jgi:hypothetical protein